MLNGQIVSFYSNFWVRLLEVLYSYQLFKLLLFYCDLFVKLKNLFLIDFLRAFLIF